MSKFTTFHWLLTGVIGTISVFAGFPSHMDPISIRSVQADDVSASSSAKATARSSSTSSSSGSSSGCRSETKSSAEVTTVINGEKKTVRQDDADHSDECGGRASSSAKAVIDEVPPADGENGH